MILKNSSNPNKFNQNQKDNNLPKNILKDLKKVTFFIMQEKRILSKYEEETIHGSSNRSSGEYDAFIQDYYDNSFNKHDVPAS